MSDSNETKSINLSIPTGLFELVNTVWGRVLAALAAISIVMGILLEVEALITGYYQMKKTAAEATLVRLQADAQDVPGTTYLPDDSKPK